MPGYMKEIQKIYWSFHFLKIVIKNIVNMHRRQDFSASTKHRQIKHRGAMFWSNHRIAKKNENCPALGSAHQSLIQWVPRCFRGLCCHPDGLPFAPRCTHPLSCRSPPHSPHCRQGDKEEEGTGGNQSIGYPNVLLGHRPREGPSQDQWGDEHLPARDGNR